MLEISLSFVNAVISTLISAFVNWNIGNDTTTEGFGRKVAKIALTFGFIAMFVNFVLIYWVLPRIPILTREFQFTYEGVEVDSITFDTFFIEGVKHGLSRTKNRIFVTFPAGKNEATCLLLRSSTGLKFKIYRSDPEVVNIDERL